MDDKSRYIINELLILALEGQASNEQIRTLNDQLRSDPQAIQHCAEVLALSAYLKKPDRILNLFIKREQQEYLQYSDLLNQLANDEKTALAIPLESSPNKPQNTFPSESIHNEVQRTPSRNARFSWFTLIISAAAMITLIVYAQLASRYMTTPVATVKDCLNSQFSGDEKIVAGSRLANRKDPYWLQKGLLEIEFDYGTTLVIEGPAIFRLASPEKMNLNTGRAYARVPGSAKGFIIDTPTSSIIDLGTEFGVQVEVDGTSSVHMVKGQASLIAGPKGKTGAIQILAAGLACHVNNNGTVQAVPFQNDRFVRGIDSGSGLAWRGQNISLADIVGGGNGLGTGELSYGILLDTGKVSGPLYMYDFKIHHTTTRDFFRPVPEIEAIDGIFTPDGGAGQVKVSSQGHVFRECPDTNAEWCIPIINGPKYDNSSDYPFQINGQRYGTADNPGLFLHANIGITYDLNVIRRQIPEGLSLTRFVSLGSAQPNPSHFKSHMDIWILVDGQVRFSKLNVTLPEFFNIDIPLSSKDRFLSLVVTEGTATSDKSEWSKSYHDWFLFGKPELVIETQ